MPVPSEEASSSKSIGSDSIARKVEEKVNPNFEKDVGKWSKLSAKEIDYWIAKGPSELHNCDDEQMFENFSVSQDRGDVTGFRKCTKSLFYRKLQNETVFRNWLCFSPDSGKLYCFFCKLMNVSLSNFSWYGVGPIFWIKKIMDQYLYAEIMQTVMLPHAEWEMPLKWQFMQDNDPKHTARTVKKWFADNNVDVMQWPAQSPDLNPIENLWQIVKKSVKPSKSKNKEELWARIQKAWYAIPVNTCRTLVESMPRRVRAVIRNKGYTTKY